ncbi:Carbonyl reductase [NADPH] 3 [Cichlidogyrus casuarinus]|uniref:Carbonyl reductase [NADPH] 3 n=1 Tax=Cichlidogyrus casuarinus TaxID=1844966 RepID=A0ABD2PV48_9PLAT
MSSSLKVALVTGSNRGIGFGIVERFVKTISSKDLLVYVTSRSKRHGEVALEQLASQGHTNVKFYQLDINNPRSRLELCEYLKSTYPQGISHWVNNAGVHPQKDFDSAQQLHLNCLTNYFSTVKMTQDALPIMANESNLATNAGIVGLWTLKDLSADRYKELMEIKSIDELDAFVKAYMQAAGQGNLKEQGWPTSTYGFSKMALVKAIKILAVGAQDDQRRVIMTVFCPGYVSTRLNGFKGPLSVPEGAITPVLCATTRNNSFHGEFVNNQVPVPWTKDTKEKIVTKI